MSVPGRPAELFQLDRSLCIALLRVQHIGRLVIPGDDPYIIPVTYTAVDDAVVFRTDRRPVIEGIVDRPVVFEVDMYDDRTRSGWSVVVRGHARDVSSGTDPEVGGAFSSVPSSWAPGVKDCVIRISVDEVTGRLLRGAVAPTTAEGGYL